MNNKISAKKNLLDPLKFGIDSPAQWLLVSPSRYEDYSIVMDDFSKLKSQNVTVLRGTIVTKKLFNDMKKVVTDPRAGVRIEVVIKDDMGIEITASAFGRPGFDWLQFRPGNQVCIRGVVKQFGNKIFIEDSKIVARNLLGRVVPIYGALKQTAGARFSELVDSNAHYIDVAGQIIESEVGWRESNEEFASHPMFQRYKSAEDLIEDLHDPVDLESGEYALKAVAMLSAYALIRKAKFRSAMREPKTKSIILLSQEIIDECILKLPFKITGDQRRAIYGIADELKSTYPLNGILSGDVGSGKTATFIIPLIAAHFAGAKCVIMAPNLLLIKQIANEIKSYFPQAPVCTISGDGVHGDDPSQSILVGTTALVSWFKKNKKIQKPNFLVIDEQQRFSVEQRNAICESHTNILEATATPIPRTAALVSYGDKSLFLLREIPVVKKIETLIVSKDDDKTIYDLFTEIVNQTNEQVAIVCHLVNSTEESNDIKTVMNTAEQWSKHISPELISVLHGKMSNEQKIEVLRAFKAKETKLLIASTVIEVGLTVPSLKTMLVTGAEKMGLVTLHQLRGRLARHGGEGLMLLYVNDMTSESIDRLNILVEHADGFTVSEKDAEQRGFGDFLSVDGDAQSGKTKTLFLGVKIGPREIDSASRIIEEINARNKQRPKM